MTPAITPSSSEREQTLSLDAGRQALAQSAMIDADRIAKRYARIFPEFADDLASSAHMGAVQAAASYASDSGVWERWKRLHISGEVRDFLKSHWVRRHDRRAAPESLDDLEDGESDYARIDAAESFEHMTRSLTVRQREVVNLVYVYGMRPAEAGRALGLSQKEGCRIHQRAIRSLRTVLKVA